MVSKYIVVWGSDHRWVDFYHSEDGIREWLRGFQHLASQETLTDYLRVSMSHLVLDDIESRGEWEDEDNLIKRAYRSFMARGYHGKFYREK